MLEKIIKKLKLENEAFTSVEVVVTIVILLILAGAIVPNVMKYNQNAKIASCKSDAASILTQLQADYVADMGGVGSHGKDGVGELYTISDIDVQVAKTVHDFVAVDKTNAAEFTVDNQSIASFTYSTTDGYTAIWTANGGWNVDKTPIAN